jgi:hypothetical protein
MEAEQAGESRAGEGATGEVRAENPAEHRGAPRFAVDDDAVILLLASATNYPCRIQDLSMSGCRMQTRVRFGGSAWSKVEVTFRIRGLSLRFSGQVQWTDGRQTVGIRFLNLTERRLEDLTELLGEIEALNTARLAKEEAARKAAEEAASSGQKPPVVEAPAKPMVPFLVPAKQPPTAESLKSKRDRREQAREAVDTTAIIHLININSRLSGRILDLSPGGCRIRTDERFPVGIYTRVETEFRMDGLPFRLGGVIQAIHDKNMVGIRFLDMSERRREQVEELIEDIRHMREEQGRTE